MSQLILIVDDNENNRKLARDVLEFAGFETLEATGGVEGVALAQEHMPGLVLMALRMPDLSGTEALKLLKEDSRTGGIPVVALTSSTMRGDEQRFLADCGRLLLTGADRAEARSGKPARSAKAFARFIGY